MKGSPEGREGMFRREGMRNTLTRRLILEVLEKEGGHLSAAEIFFLIRSHHTGIGMATVYRNLELLRKMGVVRRLDFGEGVGRYELIGGEDHLHLVCEKCGRVWNVEEKDYLGRWRDFLFQNFGFSLHKGGISLYGICKNCLKEE